MRTVRGDKKELLDAVNNLHPNLQFTLETTDDKNSLPFLDMSINVKPEGTIFCTWYQKLGLGVLADTQIRRHANWPTDFIKTT